MRRLVYVVLLLSVLSIACQVSAAQIGSQSTPGALQEQKNKPENAPETPKDTSARVIALEALYVRNSPSHTAEIVGYLVNDEKVTVYECWGVWARVGVGRWVNSRFLSESCE